MNTSWAHARTNVISIMPDYISCLKAGYDCRIIRIANNEALFPVEDPKAKGVYVIRILGKASEMPWLIKTLNQITKLLFFWKPRFRYKLDMDTYTCHMFTWGEYSLDVRIPKRRLKTSGDSDGSLSAPRV